MSFSHLTPALTIDHMTKEDHVAAHRAITGERRDKIRRQTTTKLNLDNCR